MALWPSLVPSTLTVKCILDTDMGSQWTARHKIQYEVQQTKNGRKNSNNNCSVRVNCISKRTCLAPENYSTAAEQLNSVRAGRVGYILEWTQSKATSLHYTSHVIPATCNVRLLVIPLGVAQVNVPES